MNETCGNCDGNGCVDCIPLDKGHFRRVLDQAEAQVFKGKGNERHGHGEMFSEQPWVLITKTQGKGFLTGQAMKKLMEHKGLSSRRARIRELLGVIVYTAMAIMWEEAEPHCPYHDETGEWSPNCSHCKELRNS